MVFVICLLFLPMAIKAADNFFVRPGLLPDSALYFLDGWSEEVRYFFTFGKINKANYRVHQAQERLSELRALYEKDVSDYTNYLLGKYQEEILAAQVLYGEMKIDTIEKLQEMQSYTEDQILTNQSDVNDYLVNTVPEKYNETVETTIGSVDFGFQKLLEHLANKKQQIEQKKKDLGVDQP